MSLLVDFLCRFAWGIAAGLVLTSPRVVPGGFFRVNLLVVLGLATFAALLAGGTMPAVSAPAAAAAAMVSVEMPPSTPSRNRPPVSRRIVASRASFSRACGSNRWPP